jgi:hypothetical protein
MRHSPTVFGMLFCAAALYGQNASLSGFIKDPSSGAVPRAAVEIRNVETGVKYKAQSNDSGIYSFAALKPGNYDLTIQAPGFQTETRAGIKLDVSQDATIDFTLKVGESKETVTIVATSELAHTADASVSTVIDREFVANMPLNGLSFNSLVALTPGTVTVPITENSRGQYAINGQRADSNYYTVDGVSANLGMGDSQAPGQGASGSTVGTAAFGGTNNLVSLDALQEFRITTSTYAPEYGRTPGGQIAVITRSGTNQYHGSAFDYLRNDDLDANDWFNNRAGHPKAGSRQNDFGGVFGGPIRKNRTFFFASFEGLRLLQPNTLIADVPSTALRQQAPAALQPYLAMFPVPTGPPLVNTAGVATGEAQALSVFSNPTTLNAPTLRIDHTITEKLQLFARYDFAPSSGDARGSGTAANVTTRFESRLQTGTLGLVAILSPSITNDLRANYSNSVGQRHYVMDNFGGAMPLPDSTLFPPGFSSADAIVNFRILTGTQVSEETGDLAKQISGQYNVVDTLSLVRGSHQLKFGMDWRRLNTNLQNAQYQNIMQFTDTGSVTDAAGDVLSGLGTSLLSRNIPSNVLFNSWSFYGQDTWKVRPRLTVTYGLRWDINLPPTSNVNFVSVTNFSTPTSLAVAPAGTPPYQARYANLAPRVGIAWRATQSQRSATVIRVGGGLFYDTGYGMMINLLGPRVFGSSTTLSNVPMPLTPTQALPPLLTTPPFTNYSGVNPDLNLPRTWQWNFSVEQLLDGNQSLTASYVGSGGRGLFVPEEFASLNPTFLAGTTIGTNDSKSDYEALQLQYERRFSHGLQVLASYTWSHALDTASNDTVTVIHPANFWEDQNRGDADFDVRHAMNAALVYQLPTPGFGGKAGRAILGGWAIDPLVQARSALPIDITRSGSSGATTFTSRVNLVYGQPLYIEDPTVPDGRRFNPQAFSLPSAGFLQGTLGRNVMRGFDFGQLDFALHRNFKVTERLNLRFRSDFFNLFNHPNFANPSGTYTTATTFGTATSMLNASLNGTAGGGFNALYQIGGPRSIQLSIRLSF